MSELGPILEKIPPYTMRWSKVAARTVGPSMLVSMTLKERLDRILGELVYEVETYVLTDHKIRTEYESIFTVEVPSSWFQHFKAAWMRPWILRRWPVRYTKVEKRATIRCVHDLIYPEANVIPSDFGRPVLFERWEPF